MIRFGLLYVMCVLRAVVPMRNTKPFVHILADNYGEQSIHTRTHKPTHAHIQK